MKINAYVAVFIVLLLIIIAAAASTLFFNQNLAVNVTSANSLPNYGPAPNFQGISAWINSQPLNISQLRGKVVLVDFWTYSCINCIRSVPHVEAWYKAYGSNGLVIVGVSTPEFQFEHNYTNVYNAVQQFNITYPVALDNNASTWDAYHNEYWPADYLIDANGNVRYVSDGEGNYNQTEQAIRVLLKAAGYTVPANTTNVPLGVNFSGIGTPEIYLGYSEIISRDEPLGNQQGVEPNQTVNYTVPATIQPNIVYLSGEWYNSPYSMVAVNNSKIFLIYKARKVNIVASGSNSTIIVGLNGTALPQSYLGSDVHLVNGQAEGTINQARLYNIVSAPSYGGWSEVEIAAQPGFRIYTFTFG